MNIIKYYEFMRKITAVLGLFGLIFIIPFIAGMYGGGKSLPLQDFIVPIIFWIILLFGIFIINFHLFKLYKKHINTNQNQTEMEKLTQKEKLIRVITVLMSICFLFLNLFIIGSIDTPENRVSTFFAIFGIILIFIGLSFDIFYKRKISKFKKEVK